jgi:hypothetical protein
MEITTVVPNSLSFNTAQVKGRTRGALICGGFGAVWMFQALYFGGMATPAALITVTLLALTFVAWPVLQLYSLRGLPGSSDAGQYWAAVSKPYWTTVAVESVACIVAANVLNNTGHPELVPQFIGGIVGLHFLPLAKIFRAPIYYWTGAVMTSGVLASLEVSAGNLRNLVAYGVCGFALWATAIVILCQHRFSK